jgi:hypothetical protein
MPHPTVLGLFDQITALLLEVVAIGRRVLLREG